MLKGGGSSCLVQYKNCLVLRDHEIMKDDLWVRDAKIMNPEPIFFGEKVTADVHVDCQGALIVPGFIDLQINGGFGIDFSHNLDDIEEGVERVAKGILSHGVTSFCPTVITSTADKYKKVLPYMKRRDGSSRGAGILGVHLEGPFINREKKGAHSVQFIRNLDGGIGDVLDVYGEDLDGVTMITLAPELDSSGEVIKELTSRGVTVSLGHSSGNLSDGERAVNNGASFITHLFNAMLPFHHRDPGLVGLLTSNKIVRPVHYGIIADGIHTHPAALRIAHKAHPKGLVLVTDAVSALGLEEGVHFIGEQQVEVKGNCGYLVGTTTLCGSITPMNHCVTYFQSSSGCSQVEAIECATLHPAQALGITKRKGTLDYGTDADFLFLDPNTLEVLSTYIAGQVVWNKFGKYF